MESAGLSRFVSDLRTTADELDTVIPRYSPGIEDGNIPVEIAIHLTGRFPIIYAPSQYAPAARRWMTQLNENAEVLALYGEMPEMAHNEIVGWDRERICESHVVLLLGEEETNLGILVDYFKELLDKWNVGCSEVGPGPAVGPMALFHHILVGDLASLYLAVKLELDPHTITPILELKDRYS